MGCLLDYKEIVMSDEKVYFESENATVTSSRVVVGDKNFILRNISAVELFHQKLIYKDFLMGQIPHW